MSGTNYLPERTKRQRYSKQASTQYSRSHQTHPIKNAHLLMNPKEFSDLKRRVDMELRREYRTTLGSLQREINLCKAKVQRIIPCNDIYNSSLSDKMSRYKDNQDLLYECANYRHTMSKGFEPYTNFSDPIQVASSDGHKWQRLNLIRQAEECKAYYYSELHKLISSVVPKVEEPSVALRGPEVVPTPTGRAVVYSGEIGGLKGYLDKIY